MDVDDFFEFKRAQVRHVRSLSMIVDEHLQAELSHLVVESAMQSCKHLPEIERTWSDARSDLVPGILLKTDRTDQHPEKWQFWYLVREGIVMCTGKLFSVKKGGVAAGPNWHSSKNYVEGYLQLAEHALDSLQGIVKTGEYRYLLREQTGEKWVRVNPYEDE